MVAVRRFDSTPTTRRQAPVGGARRHAPEPPGRLTSAVFWRRRLAALALVALLLAILISAICPVLGSATAGSAPPPAADQRVHVVQPGDTLWSIAASVAGARDVRAVVDELVERNGGPSIVVGQRVVLPGGAHDDLH